LITGLARKYPDTIRPALEIIGPADIPSTADPNKKQKISGMYAVLTKKGPICYADTTITEFPTSEELVDITLQTVASLKSLNILARIAMLSYSNYGSSDLPEAKKVRKAVEILHEKYPEIQVEGEVQGSIAFNQEILEENYPFSNLVNGRPNVLIFPNLSAGNIAYNLQLEMGNQDTIGPIILGLKKSVHVLQLGSTVRQIVNMVAIAVLDAHVKQKMQTNEG